MLGFGNSSCSFIWSKGHLPMPCLAVFASSLSGYLMEPTPLCFAVFSWAMFYVTVCTPSYNVLFLNRLNNGLWSENLGIRKGWKWSGVSASLLVAVGQLFFTLCSLFCFFLLIWLNFVVVWLGVFVVCSFVCFFPEKQIVCLLDLIYYLHYSKTYMIQAESENRALFCLLTLVRASLGQENVWEQVSNKTKTNLG